MTTPNTPAGVDRGSARSGRRPILGRGTALLALILAAGQAGCLGGATWTTARTVPRGQVRSLAALEWGTTEGIFKVVGEECDWEGDRRCKRILVPFPMPVYEARIGLVDRLDLGLRQRGTFDFATDLKWELLRGEALSVATGLGVGAAWLVMADEKDQVLTARWPVLATLTAFRTAADGAESGSVTFPTLRITLVLELDAAQLVESEDHTDSDYVMPRDSTLAVTGMYGAAGANIWLQLGRRVALVLAFQVNRLFPTTIWVGDEIDYDPEAYETDWTFFRAGVGLAFGAQ